MKPRNEIRHKSSPPDQEGIKKQFTAAEKGKDRKKQKTPEKKPLDVGNLINRERNQLASFGKGVTKKVVECFAYFTVLATGAAAAPNQTHEGFEHLPQVTATEIKIQKPLSEAEIFESADILIKQGVDMSALFQRAVREDPISAMLYFEKYAKHPEAKKIAEIAALSAPQSAYSYLPGKSFIDFRNALEKSNHPGILKILEMLDDKKTQGYNTGDLSDALVLLDEMVQKNLTLTSAVKIVHNKEKRKNHLIEIARRPDGLGKFEVDALLRYESLRVVRRINELHERPAQERFAQVRGHGFKDLYPLMVYGEEEMYTSTFNEVFDIAMRDVKKQGESGAQTLKDWNYLHMRNFLKLCVRYNRMDDFLKTMKPEKSKEILARFIQNIEIAPDALSDATSVIETLNSLQDQKLISQLLPTLKSEYLRVKATNNKNATAIYGYMVGVLGRKKEVQDPFFQSLGETYRLPEARSLSTDKIYTPDGRNLQEHFFYDDPDGHASFAHFLGTYQKKQGWRVEDLGSYVRVVSTASPKQVEIYSNKPSNQEDGSKAIAKIFETKKLRPHFFVHRGHSYHVQETYDKMETLLKAIPNTSGIRSPAAINIGACGGHAWMRNLRKIAPEAQVFSTKGTGTMAVNDAVFFIINERLRKGQTIDWKEIKMQSKSVLESNPEFSRYVFPHENIALAFLDAMKSESKSSYETSPQTAE